MSTFIVQHQVTNHGQIENAFFGLNIRDIGDPLLIWISVSAENKAAAEMVEAEIRKSAEKFLK